MIFLFISIEISLKNRIFKAWRTKIIKYLPYADSSLLLATFINASQNIVGVFVRH